MKDWVNPVWSARPLWRNPCKDREKQDQWVLPGTKDWANNWWTLEPTKPDLLPKWLWGIRIKRYPELSQWEYSSFTQQRFTCGFFFLKESSLGPGAVIKTRDLVLITSDWKELWYSLAVDLTISTIQKKLQPSSLWLGNWWPYPKESVFSCICGHLQPQGNMAVSQK